MPTAKPDITAQDADDSLRTPAIAANRFLIVANPASIRIAFGEQHSPDFKTHFHAAVMMSKSDALELRNVLTLLLDSGNPEGPKQ